MMKPGPKEMGEPWVCTLHPVEGAKLDPLEAARRAEEGRQRKVIAQRVAARLDAAKSGRADQTASRAADGALPFPRRGMPCSRPGSAWASAAAVAAAGSASGEEEDEQEQDGRLVPDGLVAFETGRRRSFTERMAAARRAADGHDAWRDEADAELAALLERTAGEHDPCAAKISGAFGLLRRLAGADGGGSAEDRDRILRVLGWVGQELEAAAFATNPPAGTRPMNAERSLVARQELAWLQASLRRIRARFQNLDAEKQRRRNMSNRATTSLKIRLETATFREWRNVALAGRRQRRALAAVVRGWDRRLTRSRIVAALLRWRESVCITRCGRLQPDVTRLEAAVASTAANLARTTAEAEHGKEDLAAAIRARNHSAWKGEILREQLRPLVRSVRRASCTRFRPVLAAASGLVRQALASLDAELLEAFHDAKPLPTLLAPYLPRPHPALPGDDDPDAREQTAAAAATSGTAEFGHGLRVAGEADLVMAFVNYLAARSRARTSRSAPSPASAAGRRASVRCADEWEDLRGGLDGVAAFASAEPPAATLATAAVDDPAGRLENFGSDLMSSEFVLRAVSEVGSARLRALCVDALLEIDTTIRARRCVSVLQELASEDKARGLLPFAPAGQLGPEAGGGGAGAPAAAPTTAHAQPPLVAVLPLVTAERLLQGTHPDLLAAYLGTLMVYHFAVPGDELQYEVNERLQQMRREGQDIEAELSDVERKLDSAEDARRETRDMHAVVDTVLRHAPLASDGAGAPAVAQDAATVPEELRLLESRASPSELDLHVDRDLQPARDRLGDLDDHLSDTDDLDDDVSSGGSSGLGDDTAEPKEDPAQIAGRSLSHLVSRRLLPLLARAGQMLGRLNDERVLHSQLSARVQLFASRLLLARVMGEPIAPVDYKVEREVRAYVDVRPGDVAALLSTGPQDQDPVAEADQVRRTLRTHALVLRKIFHLYAQDDTKGSSDTTLNLTELLSLVRDSKMAPSRGTRRDRVEEVFAHAVAREAARQRGAEAQAAFARSGEVGPLGFVVALCGLAAAAPVLDPGRPLSHQLEALLRQHVLRNARRLEMNAFRDRLRASDFLDVYQKHQRRLRRIFLHFAASGSGAAASSDGDGSTADIDCREWVGMLRLLHLIQPEGPLSLDESRTVFVAVAVGSSGQQPASPAGADAGAAVDNPGAVSAASAAPIPGAADADVTPGAPPGPVAASSAGGAGAAANDAPDGAAGPAGSGRMSYPQFLEALAALSGYRYPSPYVPLVRRLDWFLTKDLVPRAMRILNLAGDN